MSCEIIDFRAAEADYYKESGDDFSMSLEIADVDDVPILLDDYTNVELLVDGLVIADFSDGITVLENTISITKSDTLLEGDYEYMVITYDASNSRRTILQGKLIIE